MKINKLISVIIFFILIIYSNAFSQTNSIVDYFNNYPQNRLKLIFKNNKWEIPYDDLGYLIDLTVDIKNEFLEYAIDGGDGLYKYQYVLFKNKKNESFIGYSEYVSDGGTNIEFYKVKDGKWEKVTDKILPEIPLSYIFGKAYKSKLWFDVEKAMRRVSILRNMTDDIREVYKKRKLDDSLSRHYYLPRYGTTIKVSLSFVYFYAHLSYDKFTNSEKEMIESLKLKAQEVKLNWDRDKNIFKLNK